MCGIAGIISTKLENKKDHIEDMTEVITHRGPDDRGFYCDEDIAIGMRRLSIIDISGGQQPIISPDGRFAIIFNGEIYNFKKLRSDLESEGYKFRTKSDTEVVLKLYEKEGQNMLTKLRGMFSFCIYDTDKHKLFMARDYFGIKPLYYFKDDNVFAFSSEIKSFFKLPHFNAEVNDKGFYRYLSYQYVPGKETILRNVFRLQPGSFMEIDTKTGNVLQTKKYWNFSFNQKKGKESDLAQDVEDVLTDSVRAHMVSDVPVGAFLSGGIDSSVIATLMQKSSEDKISTFSVGFENLNEFPDSRRVAKDIDSDHTEIVISSEEYFNELPKLVWHFDEPVADPSAIALYFVARETSKKVKVVLSGEGADELFGGYNIYLEPFALGWMKFIPNIIREKVLRPLTKSDINFFGKNYLRRYFTPLEERFIGNAHIFKERELASIWRGEDFGKQSDETKEFYEEVSDLADSTKMQYIDINFWLTGDILAKADKMTMANSLELRVPFLDVHVARLASTIPDSLKFRGGVTKYILRRAFTGIIPDKNKDKKKLGFPVPMGEWLRGKKHEVVFNTIKNNSYIQKNLDSAGVKKLISDHIDGKVDNSRKIYLLYIFCLWHKIFIEGNGQVPE